MLPRELPLEPRATVMDVLRRRARLVGSRTTIGRQYLGLVRGVVSPYETRADMGLHYGDPPVEEARYEKSRSGWSDGQLLLRWAATRLVSLRRRGSAPAPVVEQHFVVSARIDALGTDQAIARIVAWLRARESRCVLFVHPHALNLASSDATLRADLAAADLVLPDGIGIRVAGTLLGLRFPANVNGTDLVPELLIELSAERLPVALIGGAPGIAEAAAARWHSRTGVTVVGAWDGFRTPEEYREIAASVARAGPCLVLVGMGSPTQERFARQYLEGLPGVVAMTVGGLFDFESGTKPRAPLAVRELGLEWAWRLVHEPRRLGKRYILGNPEFLLRAMKQRVAG
jgi:N-acetylglucosaminyldiphosphoundecaprenol N-acetyl-beta-D-mannosaminyltransferase